MPEVVRDLLTPRVTAPLPEAWHGSYTEERAREWIRDRDSEGTTIVAISKASDECVGLLLLHELKTPQPGCLFHHSTPVMLGAQHSGVFPRNPIGVSTLS